MEKGQLFRRMGLSTKDNGEITSMRAAVSFQPNEVCIREPSIWVKNMAKANRCTQMMTYMRAIMLVTSTMELGGTRGKTEWCMWEISRMGSWKDMDSGGRRRETPTRDNS